MFFFKGLQSGEAYTESSFYSLTRRHQFPITDMPTNIDDFLIIISRYPSHTKPGGRQRASGSQCGTYQFASVSIEFVTITSRQHRSAKIRCEDLPIRPRLDTRSVGEPTNPIVKTPFITGLVVQREREDVVLAVLAGREPLRLPRAVPARCRPDELVLADYWRVCPVRFGVVAFEDLRLIRVSSVDVCMRGVRNFLSLKGGTYIPAELFCAPGESGVELGEVLRIAGQVESEANINISTLEARTPGRRVFGYMMPSYPI
ncbi:hypothetical protein GGS26DRAFT_354938 [Hypomontagnella submonticulosa]|nr:hypothetical protein GGS26DRAFT_354938 [Hypomontagnella submonticulosa]